MKLGMNFNLPGWVQKLAAGWHTKQFAGIEERMHLALTLARKNIEQRTGGPFGAAVFDAGGRVVAVGVNLVTTLNCSILHAEIVALALAQQELGRYDLSNAGREFFELVSSTEPCAMCMGAIPWSGITGLVCGARDEDARGIGFDEGAKTTSWVTQLEKRGIKVKRDVSREEARSVLQLYEASGGKMY